MTKVMTQEVKEELYSYLKEVVDKSRKNIQLKAEEKLYSCVREVVGNFIKKSRTDIIKIPIDFVATYFTQLAPNEWGKLCRDLYPYTSDILTIVKEVYRKYGEVEQIGNFIFIYLRDVIYDRFEILDL